MSKATLDELKKLARSALRHAELIDLARNPDLSPNKVMERASSLGWPTRPAKAARFLAMVRRDYGTEALEAFITQTEHARSERSETEHAREKKQMEERIRKSLEHLADTASKLTLMIKHGLVGDVEVLISGLIECGPISFRGDVDRSTTVFFDTLKEVEPARGLIDTGDDDQMSRVMKYQDRVVLLVSNNPDDEKAQPACIDFEGMATFLGWDDGRKVTVIKQVMAKLTSSEPQGYGWRTLRPTTQVCRTYLDPSEEFTKQVELWLLRSYLRQGRTFELRKNALPEPINKSAEDERNELDPIVDRFLELGWTNEQVCEELLAMLEGVAGTKLENMRPQFVIALSGAKCFSQCKDSRNRRKQLLREQYLRKFWADYIGSDRQGTPGWLLKCFSQLGSLGLWESSEYDYHDGMRTPIENDRTFFRTELVKMFADGRVASVYQLLLMFGSSWGLFYSERAERYRIDKATKYLHGLLPEAFKMAYTAGHFGTAAALVQHFGTQMFLNEDIIAGFESEADEFVQPDWTEYENQFEELIERRYEIEDEGDEALDAFYAGDGKALKEAEDTIYSKRVAKLEELKSARKERLDGVLQLAIDLEKPIKLECMVYMHAPEWPDNY